ncbi:hypothetical protein YQE_02507, partial [Dendroctonus ponderosae]
MGFCSRRHLFLTLCIFQLLTVVQRQVFDFLGFLWVPILVNFFQIILIIFGFFGAYQYRPKYVIAYLLWHLFWIGWNIFLICLYLNVSGLDHETNKVIKLDQTSGSWWKKHGPGCKVVNVEEPEYEGCLIDYIHVEIFQSGLQVVLAVINSIIGICLNRTFLEEDDTFNFEKADRPDNFLLHPMYVSYSGTLHGSNKYLHPKTKRADNYNPYNYELTRSKKINNRVNADAVRFPARRSNSFSALVSTTKSKKARPQSLCANACPADDLD